HQVLDCDPVIAGDAHRERGLAADDVVLSRAVGGKHAGDEILAALEIERSPVAEDEAQREQGLRGDAVVIIAFAGAMYRARRGIAGAEESRALQRDRPGEPPFGRGAERERGARHPEYLRRNVVVAAVEPPHAAIVLACLIVLADQEAPAQDALE